MRARSAFAVLLAALLLFAAGCSELPASVSAPAAMSGGDSSLSKDANLREVAVEVQGEKTIVHLNFIHGSRNAGVEESKLSSVPAFSVTQLYDPSRLEISLAIGFADYASTGTVFQGSIVSGMFDLAAPDGTCLLYLQLSTPVNVTLREEDSVLTIELTARSVPTRNAWFVGLNAVGSFEAGRIPSSLGFTPTMSENLRSPILISSAFSRVDEAETFLENAASALPPSVPADALYTFEMRTDELPPYESMGSLAVAASIPVIEQDGSAETLPVFIDGGILLTQKGETVYYAVPVTSAQADVPIRQELWMRDANGNEQRVLARQFEDIRSASVSFDGRYVGVLDARLDGSLLYVYDTQEAVLLNMGEEGLGDYTVSFLWAPDADILYAMSGTASALQLLQYDFEAEASSRISSIEEKSGAESTISMAAGKIYFADQETMTICSVDVASGVRHELGAGIDCLVSPDGKTLAVLQMHMLDEEQAALDLVLMDPESGEVESVVQQDVQVDAFMFGPGSSNLFYATPAHEGVTEEYPFALMFFGKAAAPQLLCLSKTEQVQMSPDSSLLYLVYSFSMGQETRTLRPVTYTLGFAES